MTSVQFEGAVYEVREDEVVLDSLLRGGANVTFSCRKGSCQSCLLKAVEGDPGSASREPLGQELIDSAHFLPCVCRPRGDLVVEPADLSQVRMAAIVVEKTRLSSGVVRLRLEPERNVTWQAGQYINVLRFDGLARSYSLASICELDYFLEIHVARIADGAMSTWIHDSLSEGDELEIQGPMGACTYRSEFAGRPLILVATGTGIAPLYGIAREALRQGHEAPIRVYHGGRSVEDLYLHEQWQSLAGQYPLLEYNGCVSSGADAAATRTGRVTDCGFREDQPDATGHAVYVCGHPDMVQDVRWCAVSAGVRRSEILADPFEPSDSWMPDDEARLAAQAPDPELWSALEEGRVLRRILESFYERVYADPWLAPFFHNVTRSRSIAKQYAFLAQVFSGEDHYMGLNPFNAHHWMIISDALFDYREELFEQCVRSEGIPENLVRRWMAFHELFRRSLVKSRPRGIIVDGMEHDMEGFSQEEIGVASLCDGCAGEVDAGATVRMHRRTGKIFCSRCAAGTVDGALDGGALHSV